MKGRPPSERPALFICVEPEYQEGERPTGESRTICPDVRVRVIIVGDITPNEINSSQSSRLHRATEASRATLMGDRNHCANPGFSSRSLTDMPRMWDTDLTAMAEAVRVGLLAILLGITPRPPRYRFSMPQT